MTFGLGVNQISANKWAGVEVSAVNQVSNEILARAAEKTIDLSQANLSQFKRPELGINLYDGKTNVELQKQISLMNSGHLQTHAISTTFLNSQAASTLYPPMNVEKTIEETKVETKTELLTSSTAKDKKGNANPFLFFTGEAEQAEQKTEGLNLFA